MSVELPYAPVDKLIRKADPEIRVSSGAAEELALRIQEKGADMASDAAEQARKDGRKTVMPEDFGMRQPSVSKNELTIPVAPVDRIARLRIDDYRVSQDARLVLANYLEEWALGVAEASAELARHAGRKTVQAEDIDAYFRICGKS